MDSLFDKAVGAWRAKHGMKGLGPVLDYEKFEKKPMLVQVRFIKLWKLDMRRLGQKSNEQLLKELSPLSGSVHVIRDELLRDMREWLDCWIALARQAHGDAVRLELLKGV